MNTLIESLNDHRPKSANTQVAWEAFKKMGLPTKQDAPYRLMKWRKFEKFSNKKIESVDFSAHSLPKEIELIPLTDAFLRFSTFLHNRRSPFIEREEDPFVLMNLACAEKGAFIYVPPGKCIEETMDLSTLMGFSQLHIFVGKGATLSLNYTHQPTPGTTHALHNALIDIHIEERGTLNFVQDLSENVANGWTFLAIRADVKRLGKLNVFHYGEGSVGERIDYRVRLLGEKAEVSLSGLAILKDKNEQHIQVLIEHLAPETLSSQLFKSVLFDHAQSSFIGKILVDRIAQKTDAFQLMQALVLSDSAQAFSQPNLEIFADDVKASHGATIGQLEDDELFYLRSRGFSINLAKKLLFQGFIADLFVNRDLAKIHQKATSKLTEDR